MIRKSMFNKFHWIIGNRGSHFGFHEDGNCWRLLSLPTRTRYANGITWYSWWRLFVAIAD